VLMAGFGEIKISLDEESMAAIVAFVEEIQAIREELKALVKDA